MTEKHYRSRVRKDRTIAGVIYGMLAGFAFAATAWGIDAIHLTGSSAGYPWLLFAMGAFACMVIGVLAGSITAWVDNSIIGALIWLLAGVALGFIASHLPFEGMTLALQSLNSNLNFITLPYPENVQSRMIVIYALLIPCSILTGALQNVIIDSANHATTTFSRFLTLSIVVPLLSLAGWVTRDYISQPLSAPILAVDDLLQFSHEVAGKPLDPKLSAQMHYRALSPIIDLVNQPYRLYLGGYNSDYFDTFKVLIDFEGTWAECTVVVNSVANCKRAVPNSQASQDQSAGSSENTAPVQNSPSHQVIQAPLATPFHGSSESPTSIPATQITASVIHATTTPTSDHVSSDQESQAFKGNLTEELAYAPRYNLNLDIDFDHLRFNGQSNVAYTNNENTSLDQLYFRLIPNGQGAYGNGRLNVTQVNLNGQPVDTQSSLQDTVLIISLPEPIQPGQQAAIDFIFDGVVPYNFGGQDEPDGYGIYNFADGVLALADWYPILAVYDDQGWNLDLPSSLGDSVYSDIAFYTVDISLPADMVLVATGVQVKEQTDGNVKHIHLESGPMRDFFLIMSREFQVVSRTVDGVKVNSYVQPQHSASAGLALDIAVDSLKIFNQRIGPYPYPELDVVAAPMQNAAGVEFPGIVLVADHLYDKPDDPSFATATAHEVAHQWWYNAVGNDVFEDPWMDEALTTYTSGLYYEYRYGNAGMEGIADYWQQRYQGLLDRGTDDRITQTLMHFESLDDWSIYGRIVYSKGALFFKALRQEIGDEAFFNALKNYYNDFQYLIAEPEDLLNAFEQTAERQLDNFYQRWLYTP